MPKYLRKKRSNVKKSKKHFKARVARIARGAVIKSAEHKWAIQQQDTLAPVYYDGMSNAQNGSCIALLAQGDDYNQRSGNSIRVSSLQLRLMVEVGSAAGYSALRCILCRVHGANAGVNPSLAQLLYQTSTGSRVLMSSHNLSVVGQGGAIKILWDKTFTVDTQGGKGNTIILTKNFKLHNAICTYSAPSALTSSTESGHYFLLFMSNAATAGGATLAPNVMWYMRTSFTDV